MKLSPEVKKAIHNMKPGIISAEGFLGDEKLSLPDIINRDEGEMRELDLGFSEIGRKLEYLMKHGEKGLGEPVTVDDKWIVQIIEVKGDIPCPYEDGVYHKTVVEVVRKDNKQKLLYTGLSVHLLLKHHFLEGKGSPFRLEPKQLDRVLSDCCKS